MAMDRDELYPWHDVRESLHDHHESSCVHENHGYVRDANYLD